MRGEIVNELRALANDVGTEFYQLVVPYLEGLTHRRRWASPCGLQQGIALSKNSVVVRLHSQHAWMSLHGHVIEEPSPVCGITPDER